MGTKDFKEKVLSLSETIFPMVARILENKENAEDAVQEIMIKLWDQRKKIENHPNITGLVFVTARNYCIDLLKKKKHFIISSDFQSKILASDMNQMEWKELNTIIINLLHELPPKEREIMLMRDIDGYELSEIAAATTLKIEHVRVLLSRARRKVAIKLKSVYSYE